MFTGHDLKFDRCSNIKRVGTPCDEMKDADIPSPIAKKNSKNMVLLPFSNAVIYTDEDPQCEVNSFKKRNCTTHNYL